jgi:hypothetical protein
MLIEGWVDDLDVIYHEWLKTEHRLSTLLRVDESQWTELRDIERTTDACYHALLLLKGLTTSRREESA